MNNQPQTDTEIQETPKQNQPVQLSLPFGEEWFQETEPTSVLVEEDENGDRN